MKSFKEYLTEAKKHDKLGQELVAFAKTNLKKYVHDDFYQDMFDDPLIIDFEKKLGRKLTDSESSYIYDNLDNLFKDLKK